MQAVADTFRGPSSPLAPRWRPPWTVRRVLPQPIAHVRAGELAQARGELQIERLAGSQISNTPPAFARLSSPGANIGVFAAFSCRKSSDSLVTRAIDGRSMTVGVAPGSAANACWSPARLQ